MEERKVKNRTETNHQRSYLFWRSPSFSLNSQTEPISQIRSLVSSPNHLKPESLAFAIAIAAHMDNQNQNDRNPAVPWSSKTAILDSPLNAVGFEIQTLSPHRVAGRILVSPKCCQVCFCFDFDFWVSILSFVTNRKSKKKKKNAAVQGAARRRVGDDSGGAGEHRSSDGVGIPKSGGIPSEYKPLAERGDRRSRSRRSYPHLPRKSYSGTSLSLVFFLQFQFTIHIFVSEIRILFVCLFQIWVQVKKN